MLLCGCVIKFEDVSEEPEYSPLINTRYSLSTNMYIVGVNEAPGYGPEIDRYYIHHYKVSGPEIITEDTLKQGVVLEIQSIDRSTISIPFEGKRIYAVVTAPSFKKTVDVPIIIDLKDLQSTNLVNKL